MIKGIGGFTKEIKISPEEAEKLKSELIEWDGEFYPKSAFYSKIEYNEEMLEQEAINKYLKKKYINKDKEIERLNNIINEFEDILKREIKACNNKFENVFDRNYRRLILEEKLEQLQELKDSDK